MKPEAFLLAAGESRRMGSSKPLLPFGETTVLAVMVNAFRFAGFEPVSMVHRAEDVALVEAAVSLNLRTVVNPSPASGMSSSVAVAAEMAIADWLAVCPCDIPLLTSETLSRLVQALRGCAADVLQPSVDGRQKHPVLLRRTWLWEQVSRLRSGVSLRELLAEAELAVVECLDSVEFLDFDTPEEYRALLRLSHERGVK